MVGLAEPTLPGAALLLHPPLRRPEWPRRQPVATNPADLARFDQALFFKYIKVLRERRQGHRERTGELHHGARSVRQALEDRPARVRKTRLPLLADLA